MSFADVIVDYSFGGISGFVCLRARDSIKVPPRFRSSASTKFKEGIKKCGDNMLARLLRIRSEDIGTRICGEKFDKTGLYTCAASLKFDASCGIKTPSINAHNTFVDALYIQTPPKTSTVRKRVYMTPLF